MGYKKSFNLVTLQLIIPLSTMTKAEYKTTYGIDLDDIDIERVTLLQKDGTKNKYFVDEIKTTENGVDIYAGGNILSIGSSVSVVNNAYSVENAKSIYFHPIRFDISGTIGDTIPCKVKSGSIMILNNSSTPLDTFAKLREYLYNSGEVIDILCGIDFFDNDGYKGQILKISATDSRISITYTINGTTTANDSLISSEFIVVSDAVNKIN